MVSRLTCNLLKAFIIIPSAQKHVQDSTHTLRIIREIKKPSELKCWGKIRSIPGAN